MRKDTLALALACMSMFAMDQENGNSDGEPENDRDPHEANKHPFLKEKRIMNSLPTALLSMIECRENGQGKYQEDVG